MGITGELVRNVLLKSRSMQSRKSHERSNAGKRKRWSSSVRSYLCGDEHNSTFAADDSTSFTENEMDVTTSFRSNRAEYRSSGGGRGGGGDVTSLLYADQEDSETTVSQSSNVDRKRNSSHKELFQQQDAALIIQSAFRNFMARRGSSSNGIKIEGDEHEAKGSPSRESVGTSIEVQTGNSSHIFSISEESFNASNPMRHRTRAQVLKLQEDWDDSTVSSNISQMRIQSKLEAATRRERALAYAFSQQLRICSKKKQSHDENIGWNWLERWMAARQMENKLMDDQMSTNRKTTAIEEKESCGSNEVSSLFEISVVSVPRPAKPRSKVTRNLCPTNSKDVKKVCHVVDETEERKRPKQPGNKRDAKLKNAMQLK